MNQYAIPIYKDFFKEEQILSVVQELSAWDESILKSHNDSNHLIHKLAFLADVGVKADQPYMQSNIEMITNHISSEGLFQIQANISPSYGGTGQNQWTWMLCDAPLIFYSLIKMGLQDPRIKTAVNFLVGLNSEVGWKCVVSPDLGKFHGPGRKSDPCPYATLLMLKLLALFPEWNESDICKAGAETLLSLWEQRKERRPYMFAMGSTFVKLKAPLIWYDILHVVHVLTQFEWLKKDHRLKEMIELIKSKADKQGHYTAESVYKAWSAWEFGQKKVPSRWITVLVENSLS